VKGNILLVVPWIYDFAAYDLWSEPLGLLYIAAIIREYGYDLTLIDCLDRHHPDTLSASGRKNPRSNRYGCGKFHKTILDKPAALAHIPRYYGRYGIPLEIFTRELESSGRPDAILVTSGMTYWYPGPWMVLKQVREIYPEVPTILGGIYATLCPEHARFSGADYIVEGPGETQVLSLLDKLTRNAHDPGRIPRSLDDYHYPAHDLRRVVEHVAILTSRGCPFHCTYCASRLLHPAGFIRRDPVSVVDEIEYHHRTFGATDFAFYDDALLVDAKHHVEIILDGILQRGLSCRFHTPNGLHARYMSAELAAKMFQVGFKTIRLGLETIDAARQHQMGDKVAAPEVRRAITFLRQAGFTSSQIGVYILAGLPGQPASEVEESIAYVHDCGALVKLALYSPIPGTVEWERAVAQGTVETNADPLLHNNTIYPLHASPSGYVALRKLKDRVWEVNESLLCAHPPAGS